MMQNPNTGDKWLCEKCHTYSVDEVPRCSWCGASRPAPVIQKPVQPITPPQPPKQ